MVKTRNLPSFQLTVRSSSLIVDQPFHESTPRRVVVDFSLTINSITMIDPHPIDKMEDVFKRTAAPVAPEFVIPLRNVMAVENKSAQFTCKVSGNPKPTIIWY
ncbi:hypothetical protein NPIL_36031 [Nephila pilipes]|uniref:Ig-like domain-containing protein n=1 Tax=Nephila pilipes TaxID=299642 RepID=A0A8X6Q8P0_NEPPI|nr:hypothetical protein NPIL_36031 [Nephila pilipes]